MRLRGLGFWAAVVAEVVVAAADAMGAAEEAKRSGRSWKNRRTREVGNFPAWDSGGLGILGPVVFRLRTRIYCLFRARALLAC